MADEMDENLSSNDETRVRLPGNEGRYTKQRIFHGNGYSKSSTPKLSSKVVNQTSIIFYQKNLKELEGYRLFDMVIFKDIIKSLGCPNCKQSTLYVDKNDSKRKGCESYIIIKCFQCTYTMGKYTLPQLDIVNKKQGMKKVPSC